MNIPTFPEIKNTVVEAFTSPNTTADLEEIKWVVEPCGITYQFTLKVLEEIPPEPPAPFVLEFVLAQTRVLELALAAYGAVVQSGEGELTQVVMESNATNKQLVRWLLGRNMIIRFLNM